MQSNKELHLRKKGFMRLFISCLFYCSSASAQILFPFKDSAVIKFIDLPSKEPFDTSRAYYQGDTLYIYISSNNDLYNYFGYETAMKFREFNFIDYHILGEWKCRQCMLFCHHEEGRQGCHRNLCNYEWIWVMRENKKAFTEIPATCLPGHTSSDLPPGSISFFKDTVIKAVSDTGITRWYTTSRGDCHAFFKHVLFADNYHPVLLMKEWNYWGGCRAAGSWNYTLTFLMPADILYTVKNILLMENNKPR